MGRPVAVVAAWIVMLVIGGCLGSPVAPCASGRICSGGRVCADLADACVLPEQLAVCDGLLDAAPCTFSGSVGFCDRGVCVAAACGNGVIDPGELCDDGNTASGDACRMDCLKVERCGDMVVDSNEACDDGNGNPADGCDACVATTWVASTKIGGITGGMGVALSTYDVEVDRDGNRFIADALNHRVLRVDPAGVVTTVAGNGAPGYSGDGGLATSAQLDRPEGVAVDGLGNLFIADRWNYRIRRVDLFGVITTVAGTGIAANGSSADGDGGPATSAQLSIPIAVAVDGLGSLYIPDLVHHRIRKVDASGIITTIVGTGVAGDTGDEGLAINAQVRTPWDLDVDDDGSLYFSDYDAHRVRKVDTAGTITTIAGTGVIGTTGDGGPAIAAQLNLPTGVAVDQAGTVFVADTYNYRVRRVDSTGTITTVAGTGVNGYSGDGGPAIEAQLLPTELAVDGSGNLYIGDVTRVRHVDPAGTIETIAGTESYIANPDGGAALGAQLLSPVSTVCDGAGTLFVADAGTNRIKRVSASGLITTAAGSGLPGAGAFGGDGGPATSARLNAPAGVAVTGDGSIYVADANNRRIRRVDPSGTITTVAGTGGNGVTGDDGPATSATLSNPQRLAVDAVGNLFIADAFGQRVRKVDPLGTITTVAGTGAATYGGDGGPAVMAQLYAPMGLTVSAGKLYIADRNNNRIRMVEATGDITTVAGNGALGSSGDDGLAVDAALGNPHGVAVDALGTIYIADWYNHRIRRVDPTTRIITTIAGGGPTGVGNGAFSGDGGPAIDARLDFPTDVSLDALGNLYVTDASNTRVRRIDPSGIITTVAGSIDPPGTGPLAGARLADPRALVLAGPFTLFAGGRSGTVQAARTGGAALEVVAGRYPHTPATGTRARFRDQSFGVIGGVAYDASAGLIYLAESSAHRLHVVTIVEPGDPHSWTIAPLAGDHGAVAGTPGFADGGALTARFREPGGLYFDAAAGRLYVADAGNHAVRSIELAGGVVTTVAGIGATRGFFGDGGQATGALLYAPRAITRCTNGDVFIADTGNHRIRRVAAGTGVISTVLGVGTAASSGEGAPARSLPVDTPLGLACDAIGNLFVTSSTTVRLAPANDLGVVDGTGGVQTIYGAPPRDTFPASATSCLTGLAVVDATRIQVVDSCTGLLVELARQPRPVGP